jgi:hypothetical protein
MFFYKEEAENYLKNFMKKWQNKKNMI